MMSGPLEVTCLNGRSQPGYFMNFLDHSCSINKIKIGIDDFWLFSKYKLQFVVYGILTI